MNSEHQANDTEMISSSVYVFVCLFFVFFENPANMTTMYSEHLQQLKKSRLPETFYVADFLIRIICSKTFEFLISKSS